MHLLLAHVAVELGVGQARAHHEPGVSRAWRREVNPDQLTEAVRDLHERAFDLRVKGAPGLGVR